MPKRKGSFIGEVVRCGKIYTQDEVVYRYWRWTGETWVLYDRS